MEKVSGLSLFAVACWMLTGLVGCEFFNQLPDLVCDDPVLTLTRGECVELEKPCGRGGWEESDALLLDGEYAGIYLEAQRDPRMWSLCASADAPAMDNEPVDFTYISPDNRKGTGTFVVSIGFAVEITQTPLPDGTTQLGTFVTGGVAPFTYAWADDPTLSALDIPDPIAAPTGSTEYEVTVTDADGFAVVTTVTVGISFAVTITADRTMIAPGDTIQLSANVVGGTPPYIYEWAPPEVISDTTISDPTATLTTSTTIFASVTDADAIKRATSLDITVMEAPECEVPGTIAGVARDEADQPTGIPQMRIAAISDAVFLTESGGDGSYELEVCANETYGMSAEAVVGSRYVSTDSADMVIVGPLGMATYNIDATRGYFLDATLVGNQSIEAAPGEVVEVSIDFTAWSRESCATCGYRVLAGIDGVYSDYAELGTGSFANGGSAGTVILSLVAPLVLGAYDIDALLFAGAIDMEVPSAQEVFFEGRYPDPFKYIPLGTLQVEDPRPLYALSVAITGSGAGTVASDLPGISCPGDCEGDYKELEEVTLTPTPSAGSDFAGWSGDADCLDGTLTMNSPTQCTAQFDLQSSGDVTITLENLDVGHGRITSNPAGFDCIFQGATEIPTGCHVRTFNGVTSVLLEAVAIDGALFDRWNGCDRTVANGSSIDWCEVDSGGTRTIGAIFIF